MSRHALTLLLILASACFVDEGPQAGSVSATGSTTAATAEGTTTAPDSNTSGSGEGSTTTTGATTNATTSTTASTGETEATTGPAEPLLCGLPYDGWTLTPPERIDTNPLSGTTDWEIYVSRVVAP